jgi:integrase
MTYLCFYHGLSSKQLRGIKLEHLDLDARKIYFSDRPPVFLAEEELLILKEYAQYRSKIKNVYYKTYLFASRSLSELYEDKPVSKRFILCFHSVAVNSGPSNVD